MTAISARRNFEMPEIVKANRPLSIFLYHECITANSVRAGIITPVYYHVYNIVSTQKHYQVDVRIY